jgi:hypothetical protein
MKTRTEVIAELQSIVQTDRQQWKVTAFPRAVSAALTAFNKDRPLTATASFELWAGKSVYAADDCMIRYLGSYWGLDQPACPTWDAAYAGALPRVIAIRTAAGMSLQFLPYPSHKHIQLHGKYFEYLYSVGHVLTDDDCSINDDDYDAFMNRALAALMRDLIASGVSEPVQLHRGMGSMPNSATPLAAYDALMTAYREAMSGY